MPVVLDLETFAGSSRRVTAARIWRGEPIHHRSRHECADEIAKPVGDEVNQPLRRGADLLPGTLVGIDLTGDEEEIVADAVKQNANVDQNHYGTDCPVTESQITER